MATRYAHLLSAGVSRVEILRGPQGLMYGADAGGVVNISSEQVKEGLGGSFNAETGRYDTRLYSGHLAGGNERLDFALSGADYRTGGFNARASDTALRDDDGVWRVARDAWGTDHPAP